LLPTDDVVPLELLNGSIPVGIGILIDVVWDEYTQNAAVCFLTVKGVHEGCQFS
jgi:hypothetical protein